MSYIDGFIVPVPTANKELYRQHAESAVPLFVEFGATRLVEGWGEEVPHGTLNDLHRAVAATDGETVLFSWIEHPDRATRDSAGQKMMVDPRIEAMGPPPFDGQRMIYGGFTVLHEEGARGACGFIDGMVTAVPDANREAYLQFCQQTAGIFRSHGASRVVDTWGDDVPDGKVTDFRRAALAQADETVAFGWVEWPSRETRDAAWEALMKDERMAALSQPFDGKRMMFGGFAPLVDR